MSVKTATKASTNTGAKVTEQYLQLQAPQYVLSGPYADVLALQRSAGNRAVTQLLEAESGNRPPSKCACGDHTMAGGECSECSKMNRVGLQTKLKVNEPGDSYEQEADRIANQVIATPAHLAISSAPPRIQRYMGQSTGQADSVPTSVDQALASPGRPLEPAIRQDMEQRFGYNFSQVRLHTGAAAEQSARGLNAHAYTVGHEIVFGAGGYTTESGLGRLLLAHELAHVVQQAGQPGILQRAPIDTPSSSIRLGPLDLDLGPLRMAEGALDMALNVIYGEPLTPDEMYELLLVRRAEPLSIPAYQVNEASKKLEELDTRIKGLDKQIRDLDAEVKTLRDKQKRAVGFPKDMIRKQLSKLQTESNRLRPQRSKLLRERMRLQRGHALGTVGKGAPAGTGRLTYAGIQVVDAHGRRISLEFAQTSSTQHAEEIIVERMRANLKPDQLEGARITVVVDQKVCEKRCKTALRAFGHAFNVESIEAVYFVRPRIGKPGEATPRTTLRTATVASSAGLPLTKEPELIYRRPSTGSRPGQPPSPVTPAPPPVSPQNRTVPPQNTGADDAAPSRTVRPVVEPDMDPSTRAPRTPKIPSPPPIRSSIKSRALSAGGNLIADLIIDIIGAKFKEWRDNEALKERLNALVPYIEIMKAIALSAFMSDPWFTGTSGFYYNIQIRIEVGSTYTTRVAIVGSPWPYLEDVRISGDNVKWTGPVKQSAQVPGVREGATGAVIRHKSTQYVIYSEPL